VIFPGKIIGTYQVGRSFLWTLLELLFIALSASSSFSRLHAKPIAPISMLRRVYK